MTGRHATVLLMLVGVCLIMGAAVVSVTGIPNWPTKAATVAIAAAGGAIAVFGSAVLQLGRWIPDQPRQGRAAVAGTAAASSRSLPLVKDVTDPVIIGVHGSPHPGAMKRVPPYVPRDIDPVVQEALADSGFVLLVGDAAAGKTRSAYEAMRAALPDHAFIAPTGVHDASSALTAARAERDCVLWLDSLQRCLGAEAINSRSIADLLAGENHHRVVLATLRSAEESRLLRMTGNLSGEQLMGDGRALLYQVDSRIVIDRMFSVAERMRAATKAQQDRRLADALGHANRYGIAEYLSCGPQLLVEWDNAWERGAHPRGAALIAAAADCRRAGFAAPLPQALLDQLQQDYLAARGGMLLRPEPLADAWEWATGLRDSGNSPLWLSISGSYEVFDYLVDVLAREPAQPVPEKTIRIALRSAGPADAVTIGATASYLNRPELAETAFRTAYEGLLATDGPDAPTTLATRSDLAVALHIRGKLPEAEAEHRAILVARTAILGDTHPDTLTSRSNLAAVLHAESRLGEAEAEYRAVLDLRSAILGGEHPSTLVTRNNLGVVLKDLGRLEDAEIVLEQVAALRAQVLGADHPHTVISRNNLNAIRQSRSAR